MSTPYELMAGPWTAWLATDPGETRPIDLDATPPVDYVKLGTSGSDNYSEDGVTISHEEAIEYFRGLGKTGRRKAWRTEEDPMVNLTVHDATAEVVQAAKNGNTITTVAAGASTSGSKKIAIYKGTSVKVYTLLLRSDAGSPYGDDYKMQIWMPRVVVESVGDIVGQKGEPIGFEFDFAALYDSTDGFGYIDLQNAVKTS